MEAPFYPEELLPDFVPLFGSGGAEAGGGPAGSPVELPLLKLPPAADLEQLLIQGNPSLGPASPGPVAAAPPSAPPGAFLYRQQVTQEQEGFADGFVKALADLHKQNQLLGAPLSPPPQPTGPCCPARSGPPPAPAGSDPPAVYTNLSSFNPAGALSPSGGPFTAPQTVPEVLQQPPTPTPPSLSPLDAESQERLKAERKRLRNRIAASKCRRRKLERIARLEEKVKALKGQNAELASTASLLRAQVTQLQGRVRSHLSSGCHINAAGAPTATQGGEGVKRLF
uniref:Transcription factor JunB n=1 Tax=Sphenodon punctatus TaxID=8508 RepID=A0A8D0L6A8_SPHPU